MSPLEWLTSNKLALVVAIVGVLASNIYLLFSIQRKGEPTKTVVALQRTRRDNPKRLLITALTVSLCAWTTLFIWFLLRKQ
jgi:anti-sigma-K factor RskA